MLNKIGSSHCPSYSVSMHLPEINTFLPETYKIGPHLLDSQFCHVFPYCMWTERDWCSRALSFLLSIHYSCLTIVKLASIFGMTVFVGFMMDKFAPETFLSEFSLRRPCDMCCNFFPNHCYRFRLSPNVVVKWLPPFTLVLDIPR